MEAPRPDVFQPVWLERALRDYRVCLLDQRGTGLSSPVLAQTLARLGNPAAQADFLRQFRADSIVRDCEVVRQELAGDERWSVLGQSYGGFCVCTYLSLAPGGLNAAIVTGGLPSLGRGPDDVYRATYRRVIDRNRRYYKRYPEDVERVRRIVDHLLGRDGPAAARRFLQAGMQFGASDGFERVHYLVERAFVEGPRGPELGLPFLRALEQTLPFEETPIYAVLHEAIYCQGEASRWSAARMLAELPEFELDADPPLFTGEMVYPWMFEEYEHLRPLRDAAELLAEMDDWPPLYDPAALARNEVPVAASIYANDMYVERAFSEEAAAAIRGLRAWASEEYEHDALRRHGDIVLDKLLALL